LKGFLLDENLPRRLRFAPSSPVTHSTVLGESATDTQVWNFVRANELAVVTKDADFSHRIMQSEPPPWIVHLRFGNQSLKDFHELLAKVWPQVESLLPANKLISVFADRVEAIRD
jgi:predicted nuclease of predicted toxin-antitoxin system